jgi:hypothetical protein
MLRRYSALVLLLSLAAGGAVYAALEQTTPLLSSGSGIGLVNTVLTVQRTSSESGCVGWNGTADVVGAAACPPGVAGGNEHTGASQTQTRSLAQVGITDAANLRIVLNSAEPGGDSITLVQLVLRIYDAVTGTVLFTSSLPAPIAFPFSATGTGTSGFVFRLDAADALAAQPFFLNPNNRVGLAAELSNTGGGNETFFIVNAAAITLCPVISITPAALPPGSVGQAYSQQLTGSGGTAPYTFTLISGALPGGVTLSSAGLLSGVPAAGTAGTYDITIRVTDSNGCARDVTFALLIVAAVPVMPPAMFVALALLLFLIAGIALRRRHA